MPKKIDLTNRYFGKLFVIREATKEEKNRKNGAWWLCKCDCGNQVIKDGQGLRKGYTTSCGCDLLDKLKARPPQKTIDETGNRYGKLTVLERDYKYEETHTNGSTAWICKCDCGNKITVLRSSFINNKTTSCGCFRKQISSIHLSNLSSNNFVDETGNRYGKLLVLKKIENTSNRVGVKWLCKCDCGNYKESFGSDLRNGIVTSCGCLTISKGEFIIKNILENNGIDYISEYIIEIKNKKFRFDFAIVEKSQVLYFIEFDGKQHFEPVDFFGGEIQFNKTKMNDKLKNNWCIDNNIPLIRIPYTVCNHLTLSDISLETSKYVISH